MVGRRRKGSAEDPDPAHARAPGAARAGGAARALTLGQVAGAEAARRLRIRGPGLRLRSGPFAVAIRTDLPAVADAIRLLYADHRVLDESCFVDFHVSVRRSRGLRRWVKPQARFEFDGFEPFSPLPVDQGVPFLEWGLNWCVANHAHRYLILHAAVIARDDLAVLMPGPPGAGKSTLCAGLVGRGWRLLTDELALVSLTTGTLTPIARPISLKNESIEIIREYVPDASFSVPARDTLKGTVALMRPPAASVERCAETAMPAWVIVPRYEAGRVATLTRRSRADTVLELGRNGFNYSVHGVDGFESVARLVDGCECLDFAYGSLDEAVECFARLEPPARRATPEPERGR